MDLVTDVADKVTWVEGDVLDAPFLENILRGYHIQQIYHCAAVVSFDPRDREEMYRVNVVGTENVVNAALEVGIEKLVYASSVAAIGRVEHEPWVRETNKCNARHSIRTTRFQNIKPNKRFGVALPKA